MLTTMGKRRVTTLVRKLVRGRKAGTTKEELLRQFREEYTQIASRYPEVADPTVRGLIQEALERNGFSGEFDGVMAHYHPMFDTVQ